MSTVSLSPPPADVKPSVPEPAQERQAARSTSSSLSPVKISLKLKLKPPSDVIEVNDDIPHSSTGNGVAKKEEADPVASSIAAPVPERVQDDWQVAYVWAFIVKFNQLERIRKLECLEDFERCLSEPMAIRPDDILEGVLIQFLRNLKPGLRNLDPTSIQHHLSNYISDMLLNSPEFTVWDRPWIANEEVRAGCCNNAVDRLEQGRLRDWHESLDVRVSRNPLKQAEERGGGLFELDWRERAKLLRQMVDWQLTHCEAIRNAVNKEYKVGGPSKKDNKAPELVLDSVAVKPLGLDRNKARVWSLDASPRLYRSGNPYKRPCPLYTITSTRQELQTYIEDLTAHSSQKIPKLPSKSKASGSGGKKPSTAEMAAHKKLLKGVEDEQKLLEAVTALIPGIEKEEQRVQRARKRIAAAAELATLAEFRSTRTRRPARKVDYTYGEQDDFDDEPGPSKRRRGDDDFAQPNGYGNGSANGTASGYDHRGRLIIPGERRSARGAAKDPEPSIDHLDGVNGDGGSSPAVGAGTTTGGGTEAMVEEDVSSNAAPDQEMEAADSRAEDLDKGNSGRSGAGSGGGGGGEEGVIMLGSEESSERGERDDEEYRDEEEGKDGDDDEGDEDGDEDDDDDDEYQE